jgi:hypothetical protein
VKSKKQAKELDILVCQIYENNVSGKITDKHFEKFSSKYDQEQSDLEKSITEIHVSCRFIMAGSFWKSMHKRKI